MSTRTKPKWKYVRFKAAPLKWHGWRWGLRPFFQEKQFLLWKTERYDFNWEQARWMHAIRVRKDRDE